MKKIGIFSGYYVPHLGGVERYVEKLSKSLTGLGYEIVVITSRHHNDLPEYEKKDNVTIYRLPTINIAKNRYPIFAVNKQYRKLVKDIKQEQIDVYMLNTRFHLTSIIGAKLARSQERPVMLIEHGTGHFTVNNKFLDLFGKLYEHWLTKYLKVYVNRFYGVSLKCNVWLKHFKIEAHGVFYNSIDLESVNQESKEFADKYPIDDVVISYAGRLIREKGILNLIEAFTELKSRYPTKKLRLAVAGNGELLDYISKTYKDPDIQILGQLNFPSVMSLYSRSDIFVYPTLFPEGLPTSILEAGLMGCAVVATPSGGTEEVITDEQHGIIVDGAKDSLVMGMGKLIEDPHYRDRVAQNLKNRVETSFNWEKVAKVVEIEINDLCKKGK